MKPRTVPCRGALVHLPSHSTTIGGAIQPGDLLTISDAPGHAMKATDRNLSNGAVIGKAMEPLESGKRGLVFVLANLQ